MRIIIMAFLMLFILIIFCSSCATLRNFLQVEDETIVPKPTEQLWNAAKKSNLLVTLSILGVAGGLFALANGSTKLGLSSITASTASLFMALAVARYASWMAVFGLIGSVTVVLFSILVRRKALVEIIKGVQLAKETYEYDAKEAPLVAELKNQSKTTQKIVGNIKNNLKLKGKL